MKKNNLYSAYIDFIDIAPFHCIGTDEEIKFKIDDYIENKTHHSFLKKSDEDAQIAFNNCYLEYLKNEQF